MKRVDLNHIIEPGMVTYKGLPGPVVCDYWTRESTADHFDDGSTFQIARLDMVANTGTYIDAPFHRYAHGHDISGFELERTAGVPGVVVRVPETARVIGAEWFRNQPVKNCAVLVHTGWDRHWQTDRYFEANPCISREAAEYLRDAGAALVGIDSMNIDDTTTRSRPVHTVLLGADIPVVEHLCHLDALPDTGFRFFAVPPRMTGVGTFPVRAFATID